MRGGARRGLGLLARLVRLVTLVIVALIVAAILLVVLKANRDNVIVSTVLDVAGFFVGPFKDLFSISDRKVEVAVNYGLAALVYAIVGALIAGLLRR